MSADFELVRTALILLLDVPDNAEAHESSLNAIPVLDSLEEQFDALRHAAGDFVTAYRAASMSDEEGLLMAIDPDAMRQLWHRVDEAATDVEQAL
jgi:hypothetical protein